MAPVTSKPHYLNCSPFLGKWSSDNKQISSKLKKSRNHREEFFFSKILSKHPKIKFSLSATTLFGPNLIVINFRLEKAAVLPTAAVSLVRCRSTRRRRPTSTSPGGRWGAWQLCDFRFDQEGRRVWVAIQLTKFCARVSAPVCAPVCAWTSHAKLL